MAERFRFVPPDTVRVAAPVRAYLIDQFEIAPDRLVGRGYGETEPVASNEERSGQALNRRVEFRVLNPDDTE